jgi:hypothetical protein
MRIEQILPGSSFSGSTWTITASSINNILSQDITARNSFEMLLMSLLEVLHQRQEDGFVRPWNCSASIDQRAAQIGDWEEQERVLSTAQILTWQVSVDLETPSVYSANDIHPTSDT